MPYPDSEYPSILRGKDKRDSQRLLAAAPELLAACKLAVRWLKAMTNDVDAETDLIDIQEAIAKAEGRADADSKD